jgi:muramoyltetrapeptide carboxypeptidase
MLSSGARVGVFAPSGAYAPERLEQGLELIRGWGLEPVRAPNLGARWRYLAGTDAQRLEDLQWALSSPELDFAWMARGGSGLPRLLGQLDWSRVRRGAMGFSDGTALLQALRQRGLRGVHGPVMHSLADLCSRPTQEAVRALLLEGRVPDLPGVAWVPGQASGPVVGGNLCVLASLCGTPLQLEARGCVVLLEDIGEPAYKLDRMLEQLLQAGVFEGAAGIALGQFVGCRAPEEADYGVEEVLREKLERLGLPIVADLPVGHGRLNRPWVFGAPMRLDARGLHAG